MWVRSLGQKVSLKEEMATHSNVLAWEILWRGAWWAVVQGGHKELFTSEHTYIHGWVIVVVPQFVSFHLLEDIWAISESSWLLRITCCSDIALLWTRVQVLVWKPVFSLFRFIPGSGVAGSQCSIFNFMLLLLSCFSCVRLCATP